MRKPSLVERVGQWLVDPARPFKTRKLPTNRSESRLLIRGGRHNMHRMVSLRRQMLTSVRRGRTRAKRDIARARARGWGADL